MTLRFYLRAVLVVLLLALDVTAQDLYVSNRPFKGEISKVGSSLFVEVEAMAKALNLNLAVTDGQVVLQERSLPVTVSPNGKNLISLDQLAEAAGLTVRKNRDFGHIDVYGNTSNTDGKWDYGDGYAQRIPGTLHSNPSLGYSIKVPMDYELVSGSSGLGQLGGGGSVRPEFVMAPKPSSGKTGGIMMLTMTAPGPIPPEQEAKFEKLISQSLAAKGTILSGPTKVIIDGAKFTRSTLKIKEKGEENTMELNIHMDPPKGRIFMLVLGDESGNFPRSSMELRSIFETFKLGSNLPSQASPTYRPSGSSRPSPRRRY